MTARENARTPRITARHGHSWVDRGEPAEPTLARILAHALDRPGEADAPWLAEHAATVLGMVAADATEVEVARWLRAVARTLDPPLDPLPAARMVAAALWHAAKAALVRDFAERVVRREVPVNSPTREPLAQWLAARLLSPEELAAYEEERRRGGT